jgi:hypothetical protein
MFSIIEFIVFLIILFFLVLIIHYLVSLYKRKTVEGLSNSYYSFLKYTLSNGNTLSNLLLDITEFNQNTVDVYSYFSEVSKQDLIEMSSYYVNAVNESYSNEYKISLLNQIMILLQNFINSSPKNIIDIQTTSQPIDEEQPNPVHIIRQNQQQYQQPVMHSDVRLSNVQIPQANLQSVDQQTSDEQAAYLQSAAYKAAKAKAQAQSKADAQAKEDAEAAVQAQAQSLLNLQAEEYKKAHEKAAEANSKANQAEAAAEAAQAAAQAVQAAAKASAAAQSQAAAQAVQKQIQRKNKRNECVIS